ncbi:hypothetical protein DM02DRAFT_649467 [Periconia macrospinosa]|uniref:Cysteine-rich transmembrane CYSTM domain-containing protein n=1 Tax=Periconia macrospinosa TaxID=97972 RepID=A0A2V1E9H2_9PLEO|nr:hypothetical protein DM02DRAFT_649467 [Periconia macrospinosa]
MSQQGYYNQGPPQGYPQPQPPGPYGMYPPGQQPMQYQQAPPPAEKKDHGCLYGW